MGKYLMRGNTGKEWNGWGGSVRGSSWVCEMTIGNDKGTTEAETEGEPSDE